MIKRILTALALVIVPVFASAESADRDTLLTSQGTLYSIESTYAGDAPGLRTSAVQVLSLSIQEGDRHAHTYVPASLEEGVHASPALAYDAETSTLFVFWERGRNNRMSSDLVFTSFRNGVWSEPVEIASANYQRSFNLRIGVTKKVAVRAEDGSFTSVPELTVHAAWWNETGQGEAARYAMLTIVDGSVTEMSVHQLADFGNTGVELPAATLSMNADVLRQPVIVENQGRETVDVIYGDTRTDSLRKVTLRPVANGRLRVPVGAKIDRIGGPNFPVEVTGKVGAIASGDQLALFVKGRNAVHYSLYGRSGWSDMHSINITSKVTQEAAIEAVRRLLNE